MNLVNIFLLFSSIILLTNAKLLRIDVSPNDLLETNQSHPATGTVQEIQQQPSDTHVRIGAKIHQITLNKWLLPLNNRSQTGVGTVREIEQLPDANVQIGAQIRKITLVKREANPLLEREQNDHVAEQKVVDELHKILIVDEGEGVRKERKAFAKMGSNKDKKDAKSPKPDAKGSTESPPTTTAATTATAVTKPKDSGKDGAVSGPSAGTTEAKSQAKTVPQGPPMPPPKSAPPPPPPSPPSSPSQPQQPVVVVPPKPAGGTQSSGMALPMPIGVGGKLPNFKLIYFDARGICEPIRLIFHYAKVPFDDVRISRKQWLALKDSTVYGKVPILEVDGKPLTYCHTIARYLARSFGLAGRNDWEQAKVDEISDFHADVALDLQPYMYVIAGFHQGDKQSLRNSIFLPNVEKHFPVYVSLLKQSGSGFLTSNGITWVDFVISEYMTTVRHFEPQILDKYPAITKFIRKVQTQPQIFDYVTNREHQPVRMR
uniref:glutathione transferase n=1 Tax=Globodera rostochiensis TaxID=31243 RepID=A0A914IFS7_GLORO